MRRPILTILTITLACSSNNTSDGAETESSSSTSTSSDTNTSTSTDTGTGTDTETGTDTGELTCDALQLTLEPCAPPSTRGFTWDGQACVYVEGCDCVGPDCDELFGYEPDLFGEGSKNAAEHACWSAYIDAGCMTDPCDCAPGEFCVGYYDGTCTGGSLNCTPMPAGCEDDPDDCASGCAEQICGGPGNECNAPPCGGEWSNAIYCYGI